MRIWTYKNVNEKAHTISWRSKNAQKRILFKFTFKSIGITTEMKIDAIKFILTGQNI